MNAISLTINNETHEVLVKPHWSLAYVIREKVGLTGTKTGCEMGTCGSCTLLLDGKPIFSCLRMAIDAQGSDIRTIEGLKKKTTVNCTRYRKRSCRITACNAGSVPPG